MFYVGNIFTCSYEKINDDICSQTELSSEYGLVFPILSNKPVKGMKPLWQLKDKGYVINVKVTDEFFSITKHGHWSNHPKIINTCPFAEHLRHIVSCTQKKTLT